MTPGLRLIYDTAPARPRSSGSVPAPARLEIEFASRIEFEHVLAPRSRRLAAAELAASCGLPYAAAVAALWRGVTELWWR